MGVTNFDNLPQNMVETRLREIRQVEREQKGSLQRTSGNNLRYFIMENPGQFDWSIKSPTHPTSSFWTYQYSFEVVLTSEMQDVPLADLAIMTYTSSNGVNWYEAPHFTDWSDPNAKVISVSATEMKGLEVAPRQSLWRLDVAVDQTTWIAFKVQALSTDEVSMSIVRTS